MSYKSIKINLYGGLGNQMFVFTAGLYFAVELGLEPFLTTKSIDSKHTAGLFDITSFIGPQQLTILENSESPTIDNSGKVLRYLLNSSTSIRSMVLTRRGWIVDDGSSRPGEILQKVKRQAADKHISMFNTEGYFQDFEYVSHLETIGWSLRNTFKLSNPSSWFCETLNLIESDRAIGLHLRLGDFLDKNTYKELGVLAPEYYKNSLEFLNRQGEFSSVYVFSNDYKRARELFGGIANYDVKIVVPPDNSDPAESLILLSKSKAIICGNSTFSLWAAKLSDAGTRIIVPDPFYRNGLSPIRNMPTSWNRCSSLFCGSQDLEFSEYP